MKTVKSNSETQLRIGLVVKDYDHVNGLSRYADALYQHLRSEPSAAACVITTNARNVPGAFIRTMSFAGFDVETFLKIYPLSWPAESAEFEVLHLTHRSQATLLVRKPTRPVVITVHDVIHYQHRNDPAMHIYRHPVQKWFDHAAVMLLRKADAILASSEYTRQVLIDELDLPAEKVHCIYLGVDHERFQPRSVPDAFYDRYALGPETPYVLHVGSEEARKNLPTLLEAFAAVRHRHPAVKLLRVGRPLYEEQRTRLLRQVEQTGLGGSVLFLDGVPDDDLAYFYNAARVFAFPSIAEGFGFPVLEAMASGTPVVCSDATSLPELVGQAAVTVAPDRAEALSEAIGAVLEQDELHRGLREAGLRQARGFTWKRTAERTVDLYYQLASDKNRCELN